jgi:hypothetical protein
MDPVRFDNLSRALVAATSRRGLTQILASVTAGQVLAPKIGLARVETKKKKKHKKKIDKDKFCKIHYGGPYCPANAALFSVPCCVDGDVCTECGCCEEGVTNCCLSPTGDPHLSQCCPSDTSCCIGPTGNTTCCRSDEFCCGGECCALGNQCCDGVTCCHFTRLCCPNPENRCQVNFCD